MLAVSKHFPLEEIELPLLLSKLRFFWCQHHHISVVEKHGWIEKTGRCTQVLLIASFFWVSVSTIS